MIPVVLTETPLSTGGAAALLDTTPRTVVRWLTVGCPVRGRVVKLEGVRVGTRFRTSREAIARFIAATQLPDSEPATPSTPAIGERDRRHKAAIDRAKSLGVKVRG